MPNINFSENKCNLEIVLWRGHFVEEGPMVNMSSSDT